MLISILNNNIGYDSHNDTIKFSMKIQTKIYNVIFTIISITCIVTIVTSSIFSKKILENEIYHNLESMVILTKIHIESFLQEEQELIQSLSTEDIFTDAIINQNIAPVYHYIKALIAVHHDLSLVRILDKNGTIIISSHFADETNHNEILKHGQNNIYIHDIHMSKVTGETIIIISAPIINDSEFIGIIAIDIKITEHLNHLLLSGHTENNEIFLVNQTGYMLTPSKFINDTFLQQKITYLNKWFESSITDELAIDIQRVKIYQSYHGNSVIGTSTLPSLFWWINLSYLFVYINI